MEVKQELEEAEKEKEEEEEERSSYKVVDEKVAGFNVPVHEAVTVEDVDRHQHLSSVEPGLVLQQSSLLMQQLCQTAWGNTESVPSVGFRLGVTALRKRDRQTETKTDRQTETETDRQTDRQTEYFL